MSKAWKVWGVRETWMPRVTIRENRIRHRPGDADGRVVPRDADLAGRVVDVGALVFDLRDVADDGEAVREAFGNVDLLEVLRRHADADPFAERRRAAPDVDGDVENLALDDAKELA